MGHYYDVILINIFFFFFFFHFLFIFFLFPFSFLHLSSFNIKPFIFKHRSLHGLFFLLPPSLFPLLPSSLFACCCISPFVISVCLDVSFCMSLLMFGIVFRMFHSSDEAENFPCFLLVLRISDSLCC